MNFFKFSMKIVLVFVIFSFISCGKATNIKKILREDASQSALIWLDLIEKNGVNVEWNGSTLLGEAIKAGRIDIVEALIKDKADVNRPALYADLYGFGPAGIPPLILAVSSTNAATRMILGLKAPPENVNKICILLINAGAQVRTELYDFIPVAIANLNKEVFDAALSKYSKSMLDFSSNEKNEASRVLFLNIYDDTRFEDQIYMLSQLCKKGIKFGFFDIQRAIELFMNPALYPYMHSALQDILEYMSEQDGFNQIAYLSDNYNDNLQYINPLDLAINSFYIEREKIPGIYNINNINATSPNLFEFLVYLFGEKGLKATPYVWKINNITSTGTLPLILRIIAGKINQEIINRNPDGYYSNEERNVKMYESWTPEAIIRVLEALSEYDALYHSLDNNVDGLEDGYPPDYLYRYILTLRENRTPPYNDLFQPYYPVFEWLEKNGYLTYGIKEYLVYEGGLSREQFFSTYARRLLEKNTIPNDRFNARTISIDQIRLIGVGAIVQEAEEIIRGERIGFSNDVRDLLNSRLGTSNLRY